MPGSPTSLRVRADDLQPFEPLRLGTKVSEFRGVARDLGGRRQSDIIQMLDERATRALQGAEYDADSLALGVSLLVLRDYVSAGNYPVESNGTLYLARLQGSESLSADDLRTLLRHQYEEARSRALRDRGYLHWLQEALRLLPTVAYRPHDVLRLLSQGPPEITLLHARSNERHLDPRGLWRCVRATWSMGPEASAPGREVSFVAVDRRLPETPLGILQFRNVVPEIRGRDHWLGIAVGEPADRNHHGSGFLGLVGFGAAREARLRNTRDQLHALLSSVNTEGIPIPLTPENIAALGDLARRSRVLFNETRRGGDQGMKNAHLRVLKRAQTAQDLLRGVRALDVLLADDRNGIAAESVLLDLDAGLTKLWHYHMGFVALEMSICGAAPPFGPLRTGKLLAALAGSAVVSEAWGADRPLGQIAQEVYLPQVRERVPNPGPLVVFTSGLYPGHSAQYTRVRAGDAVWRKIGSTTGYGSFHISVETTEALKALHERMDGYAHITRTFGEGSGARFRSVGKGLAYLGLPDLRKHEVRRPLYSLPLVQNPREALLGWEAPRRWPALSPSEIGEEWYGRWVEPRLVELVAAARSVPDLESSLAAIVGGR